ncbi:hypothetical protein AB0J47_40005 [Nocardia sp. NPDC049737]|uniref:hypothetical protein n=1 Tax=Nocardia sp. NPDC049737 TaxID=3154358 RepID=UPI00341ACE17
MIGDAGGLVAWIEANLPELDQDRHHPWQAIPASPGAVTAGIDIHIHSPGLPDRTTNIALAAEPLDHHRTSRDDSTPRVRPRG